MFSGSVKSHRLLCRRISTASMKSSAPLPTDTAVFASRHNHDIQYGATRAGTADVGMGSRPDARGHASTPVDLYWPKPPIHDSTAVQHTESLSGHPPAGNQCCQCSHRQSTALYCKDKSPAAVLTQVSRNPEADFQRISRQS